MAWVILLGGFVVFLFLAITIPVAMVYTVRFASVAQTASLEPTLGTLLLYPNANAEPIAVTALRENIEEGSRIVAADEATQATLALNSEPDTGEVLGSVQIYSGTDLTLQRLRRPLFDRSSEPFLTVMRLDAGQARLFTTRSDHRVIDVLLQTPHGELVLAPGSYQVSVADDRTQITVRSGEAQMAHPGSDEIVVETGQGAWMTAEDADGPLSSPEQNLVENGSFLPPVLDDWPSYQVAEGATTPGKVQFNEGEDGRRVAQFIRMGEEKMHTEVGISQQVDLPVNVYDDLRIQLDTKILFQSLPGAGSLNSEFPMRVEISYRDVYGKELTWGHGFYYREPEAGEEYPEVVEGSRLSQGQWFTYVSPNLVELLDGQGTRPAHINGLRIYASGHNYQSMVSEVYLLAQ
jgi:hypothetical protein